MVWGLVTVGVLSLSFNGQTAEAAKKKDADAPKKIVYIPHDNRPISNAQTAEVVKKLGYNVVVPPDHLLGNREDLGNPEKLWDWLETNANEADVAVVSADSMIYGSLVGSRKHNETQRRLLERAGRFNEFHHLYPNLQVFVFSSLMRTPKSGEASGHEEPDYYRLYGSDIFRYTLLKDKAEVEGLTARETKEYEFLGRLIPEKSLTDWMGRRSKNFEVNKHLMELCRQGVFNYLVIGRDDNAPYSQTHLERRHLEEYSQGLSEDIYQSMAGIDEVGVLLLARAVNHLTGEIPTVFARYNWGNGSYTIPAYSDERLSQSVADAISVAGATDAYEPDKADLVLAINTNPSGRTFEAGERANDGRKREGTDYFADIVTDYLSKGYPLGVADVAYANGADNTLMENLKKNGQLFKLRSYAGWNTPTNSTGFAIGAGVLSGRMNTEDREDILLTRYLDDWAYQANVRNTVARQLTWLKGDGLYGNLDSKLDSVSVRSSRFMKEFVTASLPPLNTLATIEVSFPWNRMFEAEIEHGLPSNEPILKLNK
ncbi:MAG: DUF4127 family protein [Selenomonadaceae bacterium]|nr:DUF4127 family protein [Selenomonadaceae bacterium]